MMHLQQYSVASIACRTRYKWSSLRFKASGALGWPSTEVGGVGRPSWAGQAAFAVVGGFFLGCLAGFLTAGWRVAGPRQLPLGGLGSARRVSARRLATPPRTTGAETGADSTRDLPGDGVRLLLHAGHLNDSELLR